MTDDRYGADVLAGFRLQRGPADIPKAPIEIGLVEEDAASGFVGAVVRYTSGLVELEDRHGALLTFPLGAGFLIDGRSVEMVKPIAAPAAVKRTASGFLAWAAGWTFLNSAFIRMIGILRMSSRAMARWCGVVATSYRLVTFAPLRCLNTSFCCGRRQFVNTRSSSQISLSRASSAGVSWRW